MKNNIINLDDNGNYHGKQIYYWSNGNIQWIENFHHDIWYGYQVGFNKDKSINYKDYYNMDKLIYSENHCYNNQIEIKI